MPIVNNDMSFSPSWLALSILDDSLVSEAVEHFLGTIPKDIHGGLKVVNTAKNDERLSADRYGSTCQYLASVWLHGAVNIRLMSNSVAPVQVDTTSLSRIAPPNCFLQAKELGQEGYIGLRQRMLDLMRNNHHMNGSDSDELPARLWDEDDRQIT
jgi:hypothetical protein